MMMKQRTEKTDSDEESSDDGTEDSSIEDDDDEDDDTEPQLVSEHVLSCECVFSSKSMICG